jgi:UDP-glucose 4-epimerase
VCSGAATSVADILAALDGLTTASVDRHTDPALRRANEVMEIRGSHQKLTEVTGWQPEVLPKCTGENFFAFCRDPRPTVAL